MCCGGFLLQCFGSSSCCRAHALELKITNQQPDVRLDFLVESRIHVSFNYSKSCKSKAAKEPQIMILPPPCLMYDVLLLSCGVRFTPDVTGHTTSRKSQKDRTRKLGLEMIYNHVFLDYNIQPAHGLKLIKLCDQREPRRPFTPKTDRTEGKHRPSCWRCITRLQCPQQSQNLFLNWRWWKPNQTFHYWWMKMIF